MRFTRGENGVLRGLSALIVPLLAIPVSAADIELTSADQAIVNKDAAVRLGKALFWDMQLGSGNGGHYACASCHYQAGADSYPPRVNAGARTDGILGSMGVIPAQFEAIRVDADGVAQPKDQYSMDSAAGFLITGRQAPPSTDSDYIHNFWDGRANFVFNGVDPSGVAKQELYADLNGEVVTQSVSILASSQASQAVGPPNSDVEMAAANRSRFDVGYKMLRVEPLVMQEGDIASELQSSGESYDDLIKAAFQGGPLTAFISDELTDQYAFVSFDGGAPTQEAVTVTEANFFLFFGLAVQEYERTLVSKPAKKPSKNMRKAFKELRCDKCHHEDGNSHALTTNVGQRPFSVTGVDLSSGATLANLNLGSIVPNDEAEANQGFFKSTHLFNLPLTAPYFHDGSESDLEGMLEFYIRGGNHTDDELPELSSHIRDLSDDATRKVRKRVLKMMERLTDPRIAAGAAPFNHPSLVLPLKTGAALMHASDSGHPVTEGSPGPGLNYSPIE